MPALHNPSGWRAYPGRPSSFRRSKWIVLAIRVAITSRICTRSGANKVSDPGMRASTGSVLFIDSRALPQSSHGAGELVEPGAGKPDLEIVKRNDAIGSSRAHDRFGERCDLHGMSSLCCRG